MSRGGRAIMRAQLAFWREEYQLNRRIKRYSKPYIALVDGIVMGGGVGVSAHGAHLVAGEGFTFAMPEVGIGFFPDVGATYLLPRLAHRAGVYLAMTGARAAPPTPSRSALRRPWFASARMESLVAALEERAPLEAILATFALPAPRSPLAAAVRADRGLLRPYDACADHRRARPGGSRRL